MGKTPCTSCGDVIFYGEAEKGKRGRIGPTGYISYTGYTGYTGPTGEGDTGMTGMTGPTGLTNSDTGPTGYTGATTNVYTGIYLDEIYEVNTGNNFNMYSEIHINVEDEDSLTTEGGINAVKKINTDTYMSSGDEFRAYPEIGNPSYSLYRTNEAGTLDFVNRRWNMGLTGTESGLTGGSAFQLFAYDNDGENGKEILVIEKGGPAMFRVGIGFPELGGAQSMLNHYTEVTTVNPLNYQINNDPGEIPFIASFVVVGSMVFMVQEAKTLATGLISAHVYTTLNLPTVFQPGGSGTKMAISICVHHTDPGNLIAIILLAGSEIRIEIESVGQIGGTDSIPGFGISYIKF